MSETGWEVQFREVYDRAVQAWMAGGRTPQAVISEADSKILSTMGCTPQELFDFVDDFLAGGEPDFETVLAVQRIRREYLLHELHGKPTGRVGSMAELPSKAEAVDGIPWLPRIIAKARLKLRGEMPSELMYGCAGDRAFLRRTHMTLPQFLNLVREAGDGDRKIVDAVKRWARL